MAIAKQPTTILDLVQVQLLDKGEVDPDLELVAWNIKRLADQAWDATAEARCAGQFQMAEFQRGRAHAFCDVLGDQAALFGLLP